jgi:peptidoglycan-N-acetylglucosamine deacetylase
MLRSAARSVLDWTFCRKRRLKDPDAVLLSFDDGPDPDVTPKVLERLRAFEARALFFVVGSRIPKAPHLLKRIEDEGHVLGNHTFSHRLDRDPNPLTYYRDVQKCQHVVEELTGHRPHLFRAPMGRSSAGALLTPRLLRLTHVLWSADSNDWKLRSEDAALACAERLSTTVAPMDIVLLHDDNPWVVTVLDVLLPNLVLRGFDLASGAKAFV